MTIKLLPIIYPFEKSYFIIPTETPCMFSNVHKCVTRNKVSFFMFMSFLLQRDLLSFMFRYSAKGVFSIMLKYTGCSNYSRQFCVPSLNCVVFGTL